MNFPTLVYRTPGPHHAPKGTYEYRAAKSPEEWEEAKTYGWFLSLPEAIAKKHSADEEPADDAAPTREELEAKASKLSIKFDGRTSDKVLGEKIEYVLSEQEQ